MFNKVGLTISTTAGVGLGHATKTMKNSLKFWGTKKIFSYRNPVSAMKWSDISEKKQTQISKETANLAKQIAKSVKNIDRLPSPIFRKVFFNK